MLTLRQTQALTLAAILDEEVRAQTEAPTTPSALDEVLELRASLDNGGELPCYPLAQILAEEVDLSGAALRHAIGSREWPEVRRISRRVAVAASLLAELMADSQQN